MKRTFNAIGQGGFYTEKFEGFNMVYDCGTATDIEILKKKIEKRFKKGDVIDAVFISHLHKDHINGLEYLIDYCKVKKVFLPFLTQEQKNFLLIDAYYKKLTDDNFVIRMIRSPEEALGDVKIVLVKPDDENSDNNYNSVEDIDSIGSEICSGKRIIIKNTYNWTFIPFNFEEESRINKFKNNLDEKNIILKTEKDFEIAWKKTDDRKKIIDAYKSIKGDFNTNSMVLYSGECSDNKKNLQNFMICKSSTCNRKKTFEYLCYNCLYLTKKVGCLYLGDYNANGEEKCDKLRKNMTHIGIV